PLASVLPPVVTLWPLRNVPRILLPSSALDRKLSSSARTCLVAICASPISASLAWARQEQNWGCYALGTLRIGISRADAPGDSFPAACRYRRRYRSVWWKDWHGPAI